MDFRADFFNLLNYSNFGPLARHPAQSFLALVQYEMGAAIPAPAGLRGLDALWGFFAVADNFDAVGQHSEFVKNSRNVSRAVISQTEVVLGGATLIAVPLHYQLRLREFGKDRQQELRVAPERTDAIGRYFGAIVSEEDVL